MRRCVFFDRSIGGQEVAWGLPYRRVREQETFRLVLRRKPVGLWFLCRRTGDDEIVGIPREAGGQETVFFRSLGVQELL